MKEQFGKNGEKIVKEERKKLRKFGIRRKCSKRWIEKCQEKEKERSPFKGQRKDRKDRERETQIMRNERNRNGEKEIERERETKIFIWRD